LNLKQNLQSIDFSKAFKDDFEYDFEFDKLETPQTNISPNIVNLQPLIEVIKSLKVAMWFVFAVLLFLLFK
jgi:hypothetical protein